MLYEDWKKQIEAWNKEFRKAGPEKIIGFFAGHFKGEIVFASSLGAEDQVIIQMLSETDPPVPAFTLDTGRLFPETYALLEKTRERYPVRLDIYFPDAARVENMVREKGINLFYKSIENRKLCCHIRKNEPIARALDGKKAWISGLRREQAVTRISILPVEWDNRNNRIKINPLFDRTEKQVWDFIKANNIPYHELHDQGFPSIGCQPCTRAVKPGEDIRAGRWWWEEPESKECGLHKPE